MEGKMTVDACHLITPSQFVALGPASPQLRVRARGRLVQSSLQMPNSQYWQIPITAVHLQHRERCLCRH